MATIPSYNDEVNFSPSPNNPYGSDPMRRKMRYADRQDPLQNLEGKLDHLRRNDTDPSNQNPFYDNSYQHNLNIHRGKFQDASFDARNQALNNEYQGYNQGPPGGQNERKDSFQRPPVDNGRDDRRAFNRNEAQIFQDNNNNFRKNAQSNDKANFFSSMGENPRREAMLKEYQNYMRNNPAPQYHKQRKGVDGEEDTRTQNRVPLKRKNDQNKDWTDQNYQVGILPGMGGPTDNRRSMPRQQTIQDLRAGQERDIRDSREMDRRPSGMDDYRRGMTDMPQGRGGMEFPNRGNPGGGSRLAGIGSRIMDSERQYFEDQRSFGQQKMDQFRGPGDYASVNPQRDILNDIQNFKTPQYGGLNRDNNRFNFDAPQNNGNTRMSLELGLGGPGMQGFGNEQAYNYERRNEVKGGSMNSIDERDWRGNQQNGGMYQSPFNDGGQQRGNNRRGDGGGGSGGKDWLEERHKQEQDKKLKQKDELQRIYREQIEEKKRKKEEEQRRQMLEDQKEEERLRKENEDLQKQFLLEQQKKREAEEPKRNKANEVSEADYMTSPNRRNKKPNKAFETSAENALRQDNYRNQNAGPPNVANMEERIDDEFQMPMIPPVEEDNIDDMIRENARRIDEQLNRRPRYEFSKDPELEVHREMAKQINATLDDQLEKMRKDVEYHAKLLKTELTSYKSQAMVSGELRQNAQRELIRLKEDLKRQQIDEQRRPYEDFGLQEKNNQFKSAAKPEEKPAYKLATKNYAKMFSPDDGPELSSAPGITLDFETKYIPASEGGEGYHSKPHKGTPKLGELMNKYGIDTDGTGSNQKKDAAMQKFGALFPEFSNSKDNKSPEKKSLLGLEAKAESGLQTMMHELDNQTRGDYGAIGQNEHRLKYIKGPTQTRQTGKTKELDVEGEDEIEKIEKLLKRYKEENLEETRGSRNLKKETKSDYIKMPEKNVVRELKYDELNANDFELPEEAELVDVKDKEYNVKSNVELPNETDDVELTNRGLDSQRS